MSEQINDTSNRLAAFIKQYYSSADVSPGSVINELVVKLAAAVQNEQYNQIDAISQAKSISTALASTTDTYSEAIDLLASNYNTSRSKGKYVTGNLKITVSGVYNYTFPSTLSFLQPGIGLNYNVVDSFRVSIEPNPAINEIPLVASGGLYYFIVPVVAEAVGSEYQVSSGTSFSVNAPSSIYGLVSVEAYGNFTSGLPIETDKQLISRFKKNLGSYRLESPAGIANRLSQEFPSFQTLSVCGANDAEMTRSKHNILGISTFGKADVYVRTSVGPEVKIGIVSGKKVSTGVWQLTLDNTFCPGFYKINSIIPAVHVGSLGGTLLIQNITYSVNNFIGERNNEIYSYLDARFTKYQKAVVNFSYTESSPVAVGTSADFEVAVSYQPYIQEIQNLLLNSDERLVSSDYLVKAALPCFVSLQLGIVRKSANDTYDSLGLNSLKHDIFNYVNSIPFGEDLYASRIVDLCHNYNISRVDLPIVMTGDILCNDGTSITITDGDYLTIPTNIRQGVSKRTVQYFIDYYRVEDGDVVNIIDSIGLNLI